MIHADSAIAKQQAAAPKRPDFIPGLLVVKFKEDVVSAVPDIGTLTVAATRNLKLPQKVEEPLRAMRRKKSLKQVVPVFVRSGAIIPQSVGGLSAAAVIAASVRDSESKDLLGINLLRLTKSADLDQVERDLSRSGGLEYVHRVPARWAAARPAGTSADPMVNRQWGLRAIRWF